MANKNEITRPWNERPHILDRVERVFEKYIEGIPTAIIAKEENISYTTAWLDIQRGREIYAKQAGSYIEGLVIEAVFRRVSLIEAVLHDRDAAESNDASGRASLHRAASDHLTAIEELHQLRGREVGASANANAKASITLIQMGDSGVPREVQNLSDEELTALKERLGGDGKDGASES